MKRPFILFLAASCAALSSCSSPMPSIPVGSPDFDICFSAETSIKYGGEECQAQIRRIRSGKWEFCITDPYPLEGLVITIDKGVTKLSMFNMESAADICTDTVSTARYISDAFEAAAKEGGSTVKGENGYTFTGSCSYGSYTVSLDEKMTPVSFSMEDTGVSLDITKYALIERDDTQAELE